MTATKTIHQDLVDNIKSELESITGIGTGNVKYGFKGFGTTLSLPHVRFDLIDLSFTPHALGNIDELTFTFRIDVIELDMTRALNDGKKNIEQLGMDVYDHIHDNWKSGIGTYCKHVRTVNLRQATFDKGGRQVTSITIECLVNKT